MKASSLVLRSSRASTSSLTFLARTTTTTTTTPALSTLVPHTRLALSSWTKSPALRSSRRATAPRTQHASFSTSVRTQRGIQPDSAEPATPKTEAHSNNGSAAQIREDEYHEIADQYLDGLVLALEDMSESSSEGLEVEFSVR